MFEATSVSPEGRISPWDLGIWSDDHINSFKPIAKFIESQGSTPAIQLAHAGRKASHDRPWNGGGLLSTPEGGWKTVGPSAIPFSENDSTPNTLSQDDIEKIVQDFGSAAERSIESGIKVIELHFAHGYLACEFMSPLSNKRNDAYGGSFENRVRFPIEIVDKVRSSIPEDIPLFVRISSTEYVEGGWNIEDSVLLSVQMKAHGVDLIDCSSGGNSSSQKLEPYPGYQVPFASQIKSGSNIMTGAVGLITNPQQAEDVLVNGQADAIFIGRELLRNPYWPLSAQKYLDDQSVWSNQYSRAAP
jgi:2,4-dienoyl-CoA reductase-like NADH-dependent reductase (Old Yellow Enzyme family)